MRRVPYGVDILRFCPPCRPDPVAESSRVSRECDVFDQSNYILESEQFNPPRESPFDQSTIYDLAYSLLFSGSFKPGIFFGDVVSIYF